MVHKLNHVIKTYIILIGIIFFTFSCTKTDDDYIILNEVINMYSNPENNAFYLMEKGQYPKDCLNKYYIYKYDKTAYDKELKYLDSLKRVDSVRYAPYGKYIVRPYYHTNCINDSIFNKEDLQYLMTQKDSIVWNSDKIKNDKVAVLEKNDKKFKEKKKIYTNSVSKPIYNKDRTLAIVSYHSYHRTTKRLTFKKVNGKWKLINKIDNHL